MNPELMIEHALARVGYFWYNSHLFGHFLTSSDNTIVLLQVSAAVLVVNSEYVCDICGRLTRITLLPHTDDEP